MMHREGGHDEIEATRGFHDALQHVMVGHLGPHHFESGVGIEVRLVGHGRC